MNFEQKVKDYYPKIDKGDVDWVLALFDEAGEYQRADAIYKGMGELTEFYKQGRKIKGKHSLENIFSNENKVAVNGVFEGVGGDGSPKKISFADFWTFNEKGLVALRKTYLAIGSDYVKD